MVSTLLPVTLVVLLISESTIGIDQQPPNGQSKGEGSSVTITTHNQASPPVNPVTSSDKNGAEFYVPYKTPNPSSMDRVFLYESFDDVHRFKKTWIKSEATKGPNGKYKYDGTWDIVVTHQKIRGDYGLRMRSKSKHHAISRQFDRQFNFSNSSPLIVQYDVQYRNGQECGGAYLKLLSSPSGNLSLINDQSLYTIMFGPDKCGSDHRLHFIFAHVNNKTGERREIHWKDANTLTNLADIVTDGKWHLFRLYLSPSSQFELSMDKRVIASGSLLADFSPPVNPPKEIDDPNDIKPEDWDEREKVPDPDAVKPDDWDNGEAKLILDSKAKKPKSWLEDEPLMIPDPEATEPENWSEDKDGPWEVPMIKNPRCSLVPGCGPWSPPMIENPRYKGEWSPPLIPNPAYQGKWVPQKILNPDHFEDNHPYSSMSPIDAVTFELWTLTDGIVFDNILVTSDFTLADSISMSTYQIKKELNDLETDNWFKRLIKQTNKKPWLWAVYIMATAIPVIFFIGFCCVTPGSSSSSPSPPPTSFSSSTLSSTLSPSSPSSIFDCSQPSTSSMSTTINDSQHYPHSHHSPFTESCKVNHHHHHDPYAFRYHDAYKNNDSGCSSSETLESEISGLRSRLVSGGQPETITMTGYCSSSYQYHQHSHGYQSTKKTPTVSFRSACMKQMIPDEEEEEDDDNLVDEMRVMELELEKEQDELINNEHVNYDNNDDQDYDQYDYGIMNDGPENDYNIDENIDYNYNDNLETATDLNEFRVNGDDLITPNDGEEDEKETITIESDQLSIINNQKQYNDDQINEINDQLKDKINDDNYDPIVVDYSKSNNTENGDSLIGKCQFDSVTNGFNEQSHDVNQQLTNGDDFGGDGNDEQSIDESVQELESLENTSRSENPSIRKRRKGKGRRKNDGGGGGGGGNGNGAGGKSGNGKGKSRRTKARRE